MNTELMQLYKDKGVSACIFRIETKTRSSGRPCRPAAAVGCSRRFGSVMGPVLE